MNWEESIFLLFLLFVSYRSSELWVKGRPSHRWGFFCSQGIHGKDCEANWGQGIAVEEALPKDPVHYPSPAPPQTLHGPWKGTIFLEPYWVKLADHRPFQFWHLREAVCEGNSLFFFKQKRKLLLSLSSKGGFKLYVWKKKKEHIFGRRRIGQIESWLEN